MPGNPTRLSGVLQPDRLQAHAQRALRAARDLITNRGLKEFPAALCEAGGSAVHLALAYLYARACFETAVASETPLLGTAMDPDLLRALGTSVTWAVVLLPVTFGAALSDVLGWTSFGALSYVQKCRTHALCAVVVLFGSSLLVLLAAVLYCLGGGGEVLNASPGKSLFALHASILLGVNMLSAIGMAVSGLSLTTLIRSAWALLLTTAGFGLRLLARTLEALARRTSDAGAYRSLAYPEARMEVIQKLRAREKGAPAPSAGEH